ncbi:uncharacterized protein LOC103025311 isoform X1 [Astyanax mexicanus]|uniref:uncharacterized protein LOC103025311 isoform X1 n=1 Tax=Astyanax mexicanus TaxID=7994 RepID=UPI0020CB40D3|nr:uncharacterized protein LOC103025311 isoform X1 [Astyanax mexicanus]
MKLFLFLFLVFENDIISAVKQISAEISGEITLTLIFNPYYNSFSKICYKVLPHNWLVIVNTGGYADGAYKGRIETHEYNGRMDMRIWNLDRGDAGTYRCQIQGTQNFFYQDFQVVIYYRDPRPPPAWLSPKSTISSPVTTLHTLSENHLDSPSIDKNPWGLRHTLATVFGVACFIFIIAIIPVVIYHIKRKKTESIYSTSSVSSETRERSPSSAPDIIPQTPQEHLNSIIYTTVDFKPHEEASELYANLCLSNPGALRPDSDRALKTQESVEYSTVARIL